VLFPVIAVFSFVFLVEFMFFSRAEFFPLHFSGDFSFSFLFDLLNISAINIKFSALFGVQNNLKALAIALFTDYLFAFLLASFLLLLAMVAAIILTIYKSFVTKSQNIYGQIMANYDKSIVSYN
jgi:NADH:ubiquinone oxidoreductase subunit 6 (subunit J)